MLKTRFKNFKNSPRGLYLCAFGVAIRKKGQRLPLPPPAWRALGEKENEYMSIRK